MPVVQLSRDVIHISIIMSLVETNEKHVYLAFRMLGNLLKILGITKIVWHWQSFLY